MAFLEYLCKKLGNGTYIVLERPIFQRWGFSFTTWFLTQLAAYMCVHIMWVNLLQVSPDRMFHLGSWMAESPSDPQQIIVTELSGSSNHHFTAPVGVVKRQTVPEAPCCLLPSVRLPGYPASCKPAVTFICCFQRQWRRLGSLSWTGAASQWATKKRMMDSQPGLKRELLSQGSCGH